MDAITVALVGKAEMDLHTAEREMEAAEDPNYEAVCFHTHQCAERYLRARLQASEVPFPDTGHLVVLLHLCLDMEPEWESFREHLRTLTSHANLSAEPEWEPDESMARQSLKSCAEFRDSVRKSLSL